MKKELMAVLIFILIIAASIFNIAQISTLSSKMTALVQNAVSSAEKSNWEAAAWYAESAEALWASHKLYIYTVFRHESTDNISDCIYELLSEVYSKDPDHVSEAAMRLTAYLEILRDMEKPTLESIF